MEANQLAHFDNSMTEEKSREYLHALRHQASYFVHEAMKQAEENYEMLIQEAVTPRVKGVEPNALKALGDYKGILLDDSLKTKKKGEKRLRNSTAKDLEKYREKIQDVADEEKSSGDAFRVDEKFEILVDDTGITDGNLAVTVLDGTSGDLVTALDDTQRGLKKDAVTLLDDNDKDEEIRTGVSSKALDKESKMVLDDSFKNGQKKKDTTEADNDNVQANDLGIVSIKEKSKEDLDMSIDRTSKAFDWSEEELLDLVTAMVYKIIDEAEKEIDEEMRCSKSLLEVEVSSIQEGQRTKQPTIPDNAPEDISHEASSKRNLAGTQKTPQRNRIKNTKIESSDSTEAISGHPKVKTEKKSPLCRAEASTKQSKKPKEINYPHKTTDLSKKYQRLPTSNSKSLIQSSTKPNSPNKAKSGKSVSTESKRTTLKSIVSKPMVKKPHSTESKDKSGKPLSTDSKPMGKKPLSTESKDKSCKLLSTDSMSMGKKPLSTESKDKSCKLISTDSMSMGKKPLSTESKDKSDKPLPNDNSKPLTGKPSSIDSKRTSTAFRKPNLPSVTQQKGKNSLSDTQQRINVNNPCRPHQSLDKELKNEGNVDKLKRSTSSSIKSEVKINSRKRSETRQPKRNGNENQSSKAGNSNFLKQMSTGGTWRNSLPKQKTADKTISAKLLQQGKARIPTKANANEIKTRQSGSIINDSSSDTKTEYEVSCYLDDPSISISMEVDCGGQSCSSESCKFECQKIHEDSQISETAEIDTKSNLIEGQKDPKDNQPTKTPEMDAKSHLIEDQDHQEVPAPPQTPKPAKMFSRSRYHSTESRLKKRQELSLEESIALVEDSYLANLEAEMKKERLEKEKRVNDLTNALKNEEVKLEEMKLKRDSIKGQMMELWDVQMIHQDDDIAIDKYNYLKDMLVSTIERKLHQVRYVNMMKDDIKREIEIGSGVKFKIDKGMLKKELDVSIEDEIPVPKVVPSSPVVTKKTWEPVKSRPCSAIDNRILVPREVSESDLKQLDKTPSDTKNKLPVAQSRSKITKPNMKKAISLVTTERKSQVNMKTSVAAMPRKREDRRNNCSSTMTRAPKPPNEKKPQKERPIAKQNIKIDSSSFKKQGNTGKAQEESEGCKTSTSTDKTYTVKKSKVAFAKLTGNEARKSAIATNISRSSVIDKQKIVKPILKQSTRTETVVNNRFNNGVKEKALAIPKLVSNARRQDVKNSDPNQSTDKVTLIARKPITTEQENQQKRQPANRMPKAPGYENIKQKFSLKVHKEKTPVISKENLSTGSAGNIMVKDTYTTTKNKLSNGSGQRVNVIKRDQIKKLSLYSRATADINNGNANSEKFVPNTKKSSHGISKMNTRMNK